MVISKASKHDDEIKHLPGWEGPLPSKMYAGYVDAGTDSQNGQTYVMHEHYFFVECETNPSKAPVLVWTNGGPGASSFYGLFVELGPFYLDDSSLTTRYYNDTGVPSLFYNPYTWSKVANVLILNSPPPVGYSYCDPVGPTGNGYSCGSWNDTRTAIHNHEFLENWIQKFKDFQSNDMYIVGESYAGVYVPTLVREILEDPNSSIKNLKGFAVGDGCVGLDVLCGPVGGPLWYVEFMRGHGQFSELLYNNIKRSCPYEELVNGVQSPICQQFINQISTEVGGYYGYNLYDDCWYENDLGAPKSWDELSRRHYWGPPRLGALDQTLGDALNDYPCGGPHALFTWINTSAVKAALHVAPNANFFSGDNGVGFVYNLTEKNLLPFYKYVTENTSLRVLIYNGDTDPGINSFLTQNWTSFLNFSVLQPWRPYTIDNRSYVGGYVTRYKGDFDFLTIRGSGHMVPEFKPKVSLSFLRQWLLNEDWYEYNPPTSKRLK